MKTVDQKTFPTQGGNKEASTVVVTSGNSVTPPPFTLGEGLPPIPGRLVQNIQAELLRENMELERRKPTRESSASALDLGIQPSRQEVRDLISLVQCFGVYATIVSAKHADWICQLLAYQTMVVCEVRRCDGRGWQSYDAMFRQQVAISPSVDWSKMNNSLYSTTFLQEQNG